MATSNSRVDEAEAKRGDHRNILLSRIHLYLDELHRQATSDDPPKDLKTLFQRVGPPPSPLEE